MAARTARLTGAGFFLFATANGDTHEAAGTAVRLVSALATPSMVRLKAMVVVEVSITLRSKET